jgi:hypothetical protein
MKKLFVYGFPIELYPVADTFGNVFCYEVRVADDNPEVIGTISNHGQRRGAWEATLMGEARGAFFVNKTAAIGALLDEVRS